MSMIYRNTCRSHFIRTALDAGFIEMTQPDSPRSHKAVDSLPGNDYVPEYYARKEWELRGY